MSLIQASRREFLLYWVGVFVVALSVVSVLMATSALVTQVLSYNCYVPYLSPMLGVSSPPTPQLGVSQNATVYAKGATIGQQYQGIPYPYYCQSPVAPVISFVFNLLSSLVFLGVGAYMMVSGKRK